MKCLIREPGWTETLVGPVCSRLGRHLPISHLCALDLQIKAAAMALSYSAGDGNVVIVCSMPSSGRHNLQLL
jgi:hypothetical protein